MQSLCFMWLSSWCVTPACELSAGAGMILQEGSHKEHKGPSPAQHQAAQPEGKPLTKKCSHRGPVGFVQALTIHHLLLSSRSVLQQCWPSWSSSICTAKCSSAVTPGAPEILFGTSLDFKNIWLAGTVDLYSFPGSTVCALYAQHK